LAVSGDAPYERSSVLHPPLQQLSTDEEHFHNVLHSYAKKYGMKAIDNLEVFSSLPSSYSTYVNSKYQELKKQYDRQELVNIMNTNNSFQGRDSGFPAPSSVSVEELNSYRMERDLWSLLQHLSSADLLNNINEEKSKENLEKSLSDLPIHSSIPEYINTAYLADERLRKGAIITEWLENTATDEIISIPKPSHEPWSDTWYHIQQRKIKKNTSGASSLPNETLKSLDPDSQLTKDGRILPLSSNDTMDQERLWKAIWKLIRAGKLPEAQQLAAEHHVYWFASMMRGSEYHYYEAIPDDEKGEIEKKEGTDKEDDVSHPKYRRVGNPKQPLWLEICWNYVEFLSKNPSNYHMNQKNINSITKDLSSNNEDRRGNGNEDEENSSLVGALEMTIFASLCNHIHILLKSSFITSYQDKLWIYLKALHTHNLMLIVNNYRKIKFQTASNYLSCDLETIEKEEKMISLLESNLSSFFWDGEPLAKHDIAFLTDYKEFLHTILINPKLQSLWCFLPDPKQSSFHSYNMISKTFEFINNEVLLLHMIIGIITGTNGLYSFLQQLTKTSLLLSSLPISSSCSSNSEEEAPKSSVPSLTIIETFPNITKISILRTLTHFLIWSKVYGNFSPISSNTSFLTPTNKNNNQFASTIPYSLYYTILSNYIIELMKKKYFIYIPLYCSFVNHYRVMNMYPLLLMLLSKLYLVEQTKLGRENDKEDGDNSHPKYYHEILLLCNSYFPSLTIEIIRSLINTIMEEKEKSLLFPSFSHLFTLEESSVGTVTPGMKKDISMIRGDTNEEEGEGGGEGEDAYLSKLSFTSSVGRASVANPFSSMSTPKMRGGQQSSSAITPSSPLNRNDFLSSMVSPSSRTGRSTTTKVETIDSHDSLLMESLYWLTLDSDYSLELLKQCNRCILFFLSSSSSTASALSSSHLFPKIYHIDRILTSYLPTDIIEKGNAIQSNNFIKLQSYIFEYHSQLETSSMNDKEKEAIDSEISSLMKLIFLDYDYWMVNQYKVVYYHLLLSQQQFYFSSYLPLLSSLSSKVNLLLGNATIQQLSLQKDLLEFTKVSKEYLQMIYQMIVFENNSEIQEVNKIIENNNWKIKVKVLSLLLKVTSHKRKPEDSLEESAVDVNLHCYGYYDLWKYSNYNLLLFISSSFSNIKNLLSQLKETMNFKLNDDLNERNDIKSDIEYDRVDNETITSDIQQLFNSLASFYDSSDSSASSALPLDLSPASPKKEEHKMYFEEFSSLFLKIQKDYESLKEVFQAEEKQNILYSTSPLLNQDILLSVYHQLKEINNYSNDLQREYLFKEELLFKLLSRYLQVSIFFLLFGCLK
jgi:hypothetical protein